MGWHDVWRRVAPRRVIARDVSDELRFHLEERVTELVASGWDTDSARREILRRFGDIERIEEACLVYDGQRVERKMRRMGMESWIRDVAHTFRTMRRNPGFYAVVVLTLALGIGASTSVFSVVEGVLLRPLPFPEAHRLMMVWENDSATGTLRENASVADYFDFVERNRSFTVLGMYGRGTGVLQQADTPPQEVDIVRVSQSVPAVLALDPTIGRWFDPTDDVPGAPDVILLSHHLWQTHFAGAPDILGSSITMDDRSFQVLGILPPGAQALESSADAWIPLRRNPATGRRSQHDVSVVGRLLPDVTVAEAQADMARIMAELEVEYPEANQNRGAFVEPLPEIQRGDVRLTLWVILAAVLTVLAIACVNVANLLLARGANRVRETAVQAAIGAGVGQITRRFMVEGIITGLVAGAVGIVLAKLSLMGLLGMAPATLIDRGEPSLNLVVLSGAVGVSLLVGLALGLVPTLQVRGLDIQRHLTSGRSAGSSVRLPMRRALVAAQVSLALVLLLGATLLARTVKNLQTVDPGFSPESTLQAALTIPASRFPDFSTYPNWPEITGAIENISQKMVEVPGVSAAALALFHPLDRGFTNSFAIDGRPYDPNQGEMTTRLVTPDYFATVGLALVEGRTLDRTDRSDGQPVLLLNRTAARRYFPDGGALGSRVGFWGTMRDIVGIVEDERMHGLVEDPPPAMYVSLLQMPPLGGSLTLLLRTDVPPLSLSEAVRSALAEIEPTVPIHSFTTMEATVEQAIGRERFASRVLTVFTAIAVLLAVLGIHGVLAYLVSQMRQEVGIRMALGATTSDVVKMVLSQGAAMTGLGIAAGLLLALVGGRLIQGLLYGVSPTAPWALALSSVGLGLAALVAMALPAVRAASVSPNVCLKGDG